MEIVDPLAWLTEHKDEILSVLLTKVLPVTLSLFTIIFLFLVSYAWSNWNLNFGGQRVSRRKSSSPSNAQPPHIVSYEESKAQIIAAAENLQQEDVDIVKELESRTRRKTIKNAATVAARKKAARIQTMTAGGLQTMKTELTNRGTRKTLTSEGSINNKLGSLSSDYSDGLDMDHVYLTFGQLLWGYCFVGLNAGEYVLRVECIYRHFVLLYLCCIPCVLIHLIPLVYYLSIVTTTRVFDETQYILLEMPRLAQQNRISQTDARRLRCLCRQNVFGNEYGMLLQVSIWEYCWILFS